MVVHTTALFLVALAAQSMALWTTYDKPFTYECGENQVLYHLESVHNNHYEDRKWQFECKPLPKGEVLADCELIGNILLCLTLQSVSLKVILCFFNHEELNI